MAFRWGICGAGNVSHDFVIGISVLPSDEHQVASVAARDLLRAQEFADMHKIGNAYGSYEELARDSNIDVVYVGVIVPYHYEVTKMMLNTGKHVMCEKPLGLNCKEAQEMVNLARSKNLFLMEGVRSRCFPIYQELRGELERGTIGEPMHINMHLCINVASDPKWKHRSHGGGATLGLSVYCIQMALLVFKENPMEVKAVGHLSDEEIDVGASVCMKFSGGRFCTFTVDLRYKGPNSAIIYGTHGKLEIPQVFSGPTTLVRPSGTVEIPIALPTHNDGRPMEYMKTKGFSYVAESVRASIVSGDTECRHMTLEESLMIASISDEIRQQIGVAYDGDTEV